jgi:hypothetical protein
MGWGGDSRDRQPRDRRGPRQDSALRLAMDREEAIRRLNDAQIAWARFSEVRDLIHHPALRRVAVRLPNGAEVRVPRPAGREGLSGGCRSSPRWGRTLAVSGGNSESTVMANADLGVAGLASLLGRGRSSDRRRKECLKRAESEPTRVVFGRSGVRAIAAVRGALMLVAQAAQRQRGGSGEAIIATRFRTALSAMQATVLSLYFLILSRVLR